MDLVKFISPNRYFPFEESQYNPKYCSITRIVSSTLDSEKYKTILIFYKNKWRLIEEAKVEPSSHKYKYTRQTSFVKFSGLNSIKQFNEGAGFWMAPQRKDVLEDIENERYWFQKNTPHTDLSILMLKKYSYNANEYWGQAYYRKKDIKSTEKYKWFKKRF